MKKSILSIIICAVAIVFSTNAIAQKFTPLDKSPLDVAAYPSSYRVSDKVIKVIYSRPQLKGRELVSLAKNGKVWRTGANEATEVVFYKDVTFGGKLVKAGTYTLFTVPGEQEWKVILSSAKNVWGSYMYNEKEDVVRVTGRVSKSKEALEAFSIVFDGEDDVFNMHLGWGNVVVTVPVKG